MCDGEGRPLIMLVTEGQVSDYKALAPLPNAKVMLGDK